MPGGFTPPEQIKSIRGPRAACRVGIGDGGGNIVVTGTPEEVAACEASYTGRYLKRMLYEPPPPYRGRTRPVFPPPGRAEEKLFLAKRPDF